MHIPCAAWMELAVTCLVELSVKVDLPFAEQRPNDRERLFEAAHSPVIRKAVGGVVRLVPAGAKTQDQAAVADLVDRGGLLGEHGRRVEAGARDERPELHL